jgi:uncharacterized protein YjiS (DUF1127 family)
MGAAMYTTFIPTSQILAAAHIAEGRCRFRDVNELFSDRRIGDLPISKAEARAEIAKWFWQP